MDMENPEQIQMVPHSSETFGTVPQDAEGFRSLPNLSARKENHILTVRQVARLFDDAGVLRTERSITNWCRRDASGVSRLDAFYDLNDRKYFISPESAERAIAEEKAKVGFDSLPNDAEPFGNVPKPSAHTAAETPQPTDEDANRIKHLEKEIFDLKILNAGKDYFIQKLEEDRERLNQDHKQTISQLVDHSRQIGQLETRLLQIEGARTRPAPAPQSVDYAEVEAEADNAPSLN